MALIRCPKCNVQISDAHEQCPYCHVSLSQKAEKPAAPAVHAQAEAGKLQKAKKPLSIVAAIVLGVLVLYFGGMLLCLGIANGHIQRFDYDGAKEVVSIYGDKLYDRVAQAYKAHLQQELIGAWRYSEGGYNYVFDFREGGVLDTYIYDSANNASHGVSTYTVKINQLEVAASNAGKVMYAVTFQSKDYLVLNNAASAMALIRIPEEERPKEMQPEQAEP